MSRDSMGRRWPSLIEDAVALAAEYRDAGWTARTIEPRAGGAVLGDEPGLEVQADADTVAELSALVASVTVDGTDVYRRDEGEVWLYILAIEASAAGTATIVPAAMPAAERETVLEQVDEIVYAHVVSSDGEHRVTVELEDPSVF